MQPLLTNRQTGEDQRGADGEAADNTDGDDGFEDRRGRQAMDLATGRQQPPEHRNRRNDKDQPSGCNHQPTPPRMQAYRSASQVPIAIVLIRTIPTCRPFPTWIAVAALAAVAPGAGSPRR